MLYFNSIFLMGPEKDYQFHSKSFVMLLHKTFQSLFLRENSSFSRVMSELRTCYPIYHIPCVLTLSSGATVEPTVGSAPTPAISAELGSRRSEGSDFNFFLIKLAAECGSRRFFYGFEYIRIRVVCLLFNV